MHTGEVRNLFKQSFYFLIGNVFTLLAGFPFQIYVTRQIGAEGLGLFGLIDSGVQMMASLLSLGVAQTMVRYIPHHLALKEYSHVRGLVKKGGILLVSSGLLGYIVLAGSIPFVRTLWPRLAGSEGLILAMGLLCR